MARTMRIDRFEGAFAICEGDGPGKEVKMYAIEVAELPPGAKEGDVLRISDEGALSIDAEETAAPPYQNQKNAGFPLGVIHSERQVSWLFAKIHQPFGLFFFAKNVMLKKFCRKALDISETEAYNEHMN